MKVRRAWLSPVPPPFLRRRTRRGRKRQGILYENRGHEEMERRYGGRYVPSPWFRYTTMEEDRPHWCQPDGLLLDPRAARCVVFEFKYAHTPDAYWQLFDLYLPVLAAWLAEAPAPWKIIPLEVVKWFDKAVACPATPALCPDPLEARASEFNVHIWKPRNAASARRPQIRPSGALAAQGVGAADG